MSTFSSRGRVTLVACAIVSVAGCNAAARPFARLESAVVNDRYDGTPGRGNLRIVRGDSVVSPSLSMRLGTGDSIITSASTRAVLTFAAGYEVTLDTSTALFIEPPASAAPGPSGSSASSPGLVNQRLTNVPQGTGVVRGGVRSRPVLWPGNAPLPADSTHPSIFVRIGRAFIRRLTGAPDTLDTRTPQAVLHDQGTEYVVTVNAGTTTVRVVTGAVLADSRDGTWRGVRYGAREGGVMRANAPVQRMPALQPAELEAELRWVRQVERLTKVSVPALDSMTEAQARAALDRVGLRVLFVMRREVSGYAPGTVVESTPGTGELVAPGTFLTLVLAKEARTAGGRDCTVPRITGGTEQQALRLLEGARLKGEATQRIGEIDVVTFQREKPGMPIACGSVVHYTWGRIG